MQPDLLPAGDLHRRCPFITLLLILLGSMFCNIVHAREQPGPEPVLLLLEVRLDKSVLSAAVPAYDVGEHTLLPLGELARLLTIAIQTQPAEGTASGFILSEDRGFSLSLSDASVTRAGITESFDPALVMAEPDDLYVSAALLEAWLPMALEIDRSSLSLRVHPFEVLPLQARLLRERLGERAGSRGGYEDPGYAHHPQPYRLFSMPFIDQTLATEVRHSDGTTQTDARYTAFLTGDLLGMESSLYFAASDDDPEYDVRATLARHDPGGNLLGPLRARSFSVGSFSAPAVDNISSGASGEGIMVSNRPLTRPTRFDRQTFEGDLPPGWDVELYYNDALVDFRQADAEGRYRFEDQPLSFGRNDFRLVFNGPLGQRRVEQASFTLDQSMVRPGEFQYSLTEHRDDSGDPRSMARFDLGLARALSLSAGFVRAPAGEAGQQEAEEQYTDLGLRTYWQSMSVSGEFVQARSGGSLAGVGLQTRLGGMAVDASRKQLNRFQSDVFSASGDPIRTRDALRLSGALPVGARARLPAAIEATRDVLASGNVNTTVNARVSTYLYNTALTNTLRWQSLADHESTSGSLRASRRVRNTSLRGEVNYNLNASREVSSLAFATDHYLSDGYRLNLGVVRHFVSPQTQYLAGFTKSLGRYGLGVNTSYSDTDEIALGLQLFMAMGHDPRRSNWLLGARPVANSGAASVRMFLDDNDTGVMDAGEEPLEGIGFTVNGGKHHARTDAAGIAHIDHLPVHQYVDIAVDRSTLIDPQWAPGNRGLRMVPRPGGVARMEFPVLTTTEIDGTVYLLDKDGERGIGNLRLELINERNEVVAQTLSAWDGFYIFPDVSTGEEYWLRVSPAQLKRLELVDTGFHVLSVPHGSNFISGIDVLIAPLSPHPGQQPAARNDAWIKQHENGQVIDHIRGQMGG